NEIVNLPIWRRYYAGILGERNLFIIDHGSSDGSTDHLAEITKLWLNRDELDEHKRCVFMASFVKSLLEYFDTVIYTDCDEILVPDLGIYSDLKDYIDQTALITSQGSASISRTSLLSSPRLISANRSSVN